jgi:antitoxin VapB
MAQAKVAKLFKNGASQAVRLPAEFRFEGDEVYISRDEKTQDVILSTRFQAQKWDEFFEFVRGIEVPEGWMEDRPMNRISVDRDPPLFSEDD